MDPYGLVFIELTVSMSFGGFMRRLLGCILMLAAPAAYATNILSIQLDGGSFDGATFTANTQSWNTIAGDGVWVLGITNTLVDSPFLNAPDTSLTPSIPTGVYWMYNEPTDFGTAVQVTVTYDTLDTAVSVFNVGSLTNPESWTLLSGSTLLSLASTGQTQIDRVASGDGAGSMSASGTNDNVLQLGVGDVPEPGSLFLLTGGLALFAGLRRRK
jgi:hypothetical protein